jgi:uncharacterized protein (DUF2267 family)
MNKDINVLRKSLSLAYVYGKLQQENLEVAVHEMQVINNPDANRMRDKLEKVISANRNAFRILERNVSQEEVQDLRDDLDKLMDVSWKDNNA